MNDFNIIYSNKFGKELTLGYMENDKFILEHCFNLFVKFNIDTYNFNSLHYINLPDYSFDCFLKLRQVELDTIQDEEMLKNFIGAMKGGICGVMGNRFIYSNSNKNSYSKSESNNRNDSKSNS